MASDNYDISNFAGRLRAFLNAIDEKPSPFSKKIGISASFMSDILNEKSGPSAKLMFGIANNYQYINLSWLLTGRGEMFLPGDDDIERQKVMLQFWKGNYLTVEASFLLARDRVLNKYGKESAELFENLLQPLEVKTFFPHSIKDVKKEVAVAENSKEKKEGESI